MVGGAVGALLGGGTGVVTVPVLERLTSLPRKTIHGTANLVNVSVAVVGAAFYGLRGGHIDMTAGAGLMIGGVAGAFFGARLAARASDRALRTAFAVVLAVAGTELCLDAAGVGPSSGSALLGAGVRAEVAAVVALTLAIGVVVGAWSAAMGLGGGSLTVPVLILLFGVAAHTAEGTSLMVMLPNSVTASVQHLRQRTASPQLGAALAYGAAPGAVLGASVGLLLSSTTLDWVFGLFILFIAAQQVRRMLARAANSPAEHLADVAAPQRSDPGRGEEGPVRDHHERARPLRRSMREGLSGSDHDVRGDGGRDHDGPEQPALMPHVVQPVEEALHRGEAARVDRDSHDHGADLVADDRAEPQPEAGPQHEREQAEQHRVDHG
jgi:uncharacterized protein